MKFCAALLRRLFCLAGLWLCPLIWMPAAAQVPAQVPAQMATQTPAPQSPDPASRSAASSLIESRQAEVTQLGRLVYRVRLDDGLWTHQPSAVCPAFKHYVFARYDRKGASENPTSFLAIYPVGHPPAKSLNRPWEGGILLQPVAGMRPDPDSPVAEQDQTMQVFNRLWADELKRAGEQNGQPGAFPGLSWAGLADCYARFAGEMPLKPEADDASSPPIDLSNSAVNGILIPLVAQGTMDRSLVLSFDTHGLIIGTHISTAPHVSMPAQ